MKSELNIASNDPVFSVSTAAKLLEMSVHTLRKYENEGLILPFKKDSGQRLYSQDDLTRIECIRNAVTEKKISINGIKTLYSIIPCWQIINCLDEERKNCIAYKEDSKPCWAYDHKSGTCSSNECRVCPVYVELAGCGNVKDIIKKLSRSNKYE